MSSLKGGDIFYGKQRSKIKKNIKIKINKAKKNKIKNKSKSKMDTNPDYMNSQPGGNTLAQQKHNEKSCKKKQKLYIT